MPPVDPDDRDLAALRARLPAEPPDGLGGFGRDPQDEDDADEAALRRLGAVARALRDDDFAAEEPPPAVWAAIAAAVDAPSTGAAGPLPPLATNPTKPSAAPAGPRAVPPPTPTPPEPRPAAGERTAPPASPEPSPAVPLRRGGRRLVPARWRLAAAAAVVLVVAAGAVAVAGQDSGPDVLASAVLEPLVDATGPGEAELVSSDGTTRLDLSLSAAGLPDPDGYYEVWLIDRDVRGMVSLGPVRDDGTYDVPADVDVTQFPIVDVSAEPADGNPTHSGSSVLRGTLA
jgi:anti-sigma-K factor RskA